MMPPRVLHAPTEASRMTHNEAYHGRTVASYRAPGAPLETGFYARSARLPRHEHEYTHFCIVLDGERLF